MVFMQVDYKLPPFFDCCLTFLGFSEEEKAHMEETTIEQGIVEICTLMIYMEKFLPF